MIGAVAEDPESLTDAGAAYVFDLSGSTWVETQLLSGGDAALTDKFGEYVALNGDNALIGAFQYDTDVGQSNNAGAAYFFELIGSTWVETHILTGSLAGGNTNDRFGTAVAMDTENILVGASQEDPNGISNAGVAYVFDCLFSQKYVL